MSARNLFLLKLYKEEEVRYIYNQLYEYMKNNKFGIKFEPKKYSDELLEILNCEKNYFTLTDDKNSMECDEIFQDIDAFEYAQTFPKSKFETKEKEFLYSKLSFIGELLKIIFKYDTVELVEVYISDQYSITLEDYSKVINVNEKSFVDELIQSYEPSRGKKYFGIKTVKFIVKK